MHWTTAILLASPILAAAASGRPFGLTKDANAFASLQFDYIIVGGGTAGLALAARLSEKSSITVGVIEAGDIHLNEPLIDTPALLGRALGNPSFDWGFKTIPQANDLNRTIGINRGKMLGGSSALNFILYHRASRAEYDAWAQLGATGWDFNSLLPFFKKQETVTPGPGNVFPDLPHSPGTNNSDEGRSGPVKVSYNNFYTDLEHPYVQSMLNNGIPVNADPESGDATGTFNSPRAVDVQTGNRSYAVPAYLLPVQSRRNLLVLLSSQATQVIFNASQSKVTATGIKFNTNGTSFTVSAKKEVILSAGSIQTPQLLELSGIGNPKLLGSLGIKTIINNSFVGENLQDHLAVGSTFLLKNASIISLNTLNLNATFNTEELQLYQSEASGIFTFTFPALSFNPLQSFTLSSDLKSIASQIVKDSLTKTRSVFHAKQIAIQSALLAQGKIGQIEFVLTPGVIGATPANPGVDTVSITSFGSRPFSRGSVHINTTNPLAPPVIDPRFLDFSFDRESLVSALKFVQKVAATEPLASFFSGPVQPPVNTTDFDTYLLNNLRTEFHPVGTAAIGPENGGGVVDPNLKVYGTTNLRVVDASVFPLHIAAHTQATVYAIAEKAATIILGAN